MQLGVIRNFKKEELFTGLMEDQKPGLVRQQEVAKEGRLEPKVNVFKICVKLWRCGEETNETQTYHRRGLGAGFRL